MAYLRELKIPISKLICPLCYPYCSTHLFKSTWFLFTHVLPWFSWSKGICRDTDYALKPTKVFSKIKLTLPHCLTPFIHTRVILICYNTAARGLVDIYTRLPRVRIYQSNPGQAVFTLQRSNSWKDEESPSSNGNHSKLLRWPLPILVSRNI